MIFKITFNANVKVDHNEINYVDGKGHETNRIQKSADLTIHQ